MKRLPICFLPLLMLIASLFSACTCHCPANNGFPINIDLYNFSACAADSAVIKLYTSSSNFSNPLDSGVYHSFYIRGAEYEIQVPGEDSLVPDTALNILVHIPTDSLTYKITNITAKTEYTSSTDFSCCGERHMAYLVYTGYTLNNVRYTIPGNGNTIPTISITK